jgi:hypothetical protein
LCFSVGTKARPYRAFLVQRIAESALQPFVFISKSSQLQLRVALA